MAKPKPGKIFLGSATVSGGGASRRHRELLEALCGVPCGSIVAVSGGCDSLSLLHACHRAGLQPIAAHFNHRWHPREDGWVQHLRSWCRRRGIPFYCGVSEHPTPGKETAAREERYQWLLELATALRVPSVLMAHHADDQAETVLMRLLRGTGPAGLAGMAVRSERQGVVLLRPWLHLRRQQIADYAKAYRLGYIDDPFNHPRYGLRNKIRSRVLPLLHRLAGHDITPALSRLARHCAEDCAYLEELARSALGECRDRSVPQRLHTRQLARLPAAISRRVVAAWLAEEYPGHHISEELLDGILAIATSTGLPSRLNLPGGAVVCRRAARLIVVQATAGAAVHHLG